MDIIFVSHQFVYTAIRSQFDDAISNGIDKLVVMA